MSAGEIVLTASEFTRLATSPSIEGILGRPPRLPRMRRWRCPAQVRYRPCGRGRSAHLARSHRRCTSLGSSCICSYLHRHGGGGKSSPSAGRPTVTIDELTVKHLTSLSSGMPETTSTAVRMKSSSVERVLGPKVLVAAGLDDVVRTRPHDVELIRTSFLRSLQGRPLYEARGFEVVNWCEIPGNWLGASPDGVLRWPGMARSPKVAA